MYYGKQLDINHFTGKFDISAIQGTIDQRGCHHVFLRTGVRIRASQLASAINDFNQCVPDTRAMRLQEEPFQPAIVTMTSKKMEGSIYFKIMEDMKKKEDGGRSEYWSWEKTGVGATKQQNSFLQGHGDVSPLGIFDVEAHNSGLGSKKMKICDDRMEELSQKTLSGYPQSNMSNENPGDRESVEPMARQEHEAELKARDEQHAAELRQLRESTVSRLLFCVLGCADVLCFFTGC
jgi:hypothetical protein